MTWQENNLPTTVKLEAIAMVDKRSGTFVESDAEVAADDVLCHADIFGDDIRALFVRRVIEKLQDYLDHTKLPDVHVDHTVRRCNVDVDEEDDHTPYEPHDYVQRGE